MLPGQPQVVAGQVHVDRENIVAEKTYYANLDGATYYFKDGKGARFENGVYTTVFPGEQEELDALCGTPEVKAEKGVGKDNKPYEIQAKPARPRLATNHMFFNHEVDVQRTDAKLMKEVSKSTGQSVNSQQLAGLTR